MLRRKKATERPDPLVALAPRWRAAVDAAQTARTRFGSLTERTAPGPLRVQLDELAVRLDAGVAYAIEIAQRANETEVALRDLGTDDVAERLKTARRRLAQLPEADAQRPRAEQEVAYLSEQFGSLNRLRNGLDTAADRLAELELRMETAVTRAAELALSPGASLGDTGIDDVVDQLASLQAAMTELRSPPAT
jgi:hypothetical protein